VPRRAEEKALDGTNFETDFDLIFRRVR